MGVHLKWDFASRNIYSLWNSSLAFCVMSTLCMCECVCGGTHEGGLQGFVGCTILMGHRKEVLSFCMDENVRISRVWISWLSGLDCFFWSSAPSFSLGACSVIVPSTDYSLSSATLHHAWIVGSFALDRNDSCRNCDHILPLVVCFCRSDGSYQGTVVTGMRVWTDRTRGIG